MVIITNSILMGIILIVFLVLLALIIASVMGLKKVHEESFERGNEMIKTVYVYLILFATLMMTIGGTVAAFMAVADIVSPPSNYNQSFEQYKMQSQYKPGAPPTAVTPSQTSSDAELKSQYDQMIIDQKASDKERAVNSLIKSFGWIIVPLPIFLFFQRRMKRQPA